MQILVPGYLYWDGFKYILTPGTSGTPINVNGSGLWHETNSVLDSNAYIGTAGQFVVTNAAGNDTSWITISGDITASSSTPGQLTITGIRGNSLPSPSGSNTYLNWNGASLSWTTISSGSFTAGGDLSGTSTVQNVIGIHGATVPTAASFATGNTLFISSTAGSGALSYGPLNLSGGPNYVTGTLSAANIPNLAGDVTGAINSNTVTAIRGEPISGITPTTIGQLFTWNGTSWQPTQSGVIPTTGEVLTWNGSNWAPASGGGGGGFTPPTGYGFIHITGSLMDGSANIGTLGQFAVTNYFSGSSGPLDTKWYTLSGDLTPGTISGSNYPITVSGIQTHAIAAPTGTGTALVWNSGSSGSFSWSALNGDTTGSLTANTVVNIHGASVPVATGSAVGNTLYISSISGSGTLNYGPLNLSGGPNYVTGTLSAANIPNLAGDVTGAINSNTVVKIQGSAVSSTAPSVNGQLFMWSGSQWQPTSTTPPSPSNVLSWTGTTWAPASAGGISITGTGIIHVTSSTIDTSAYIGSAGYILTTNGSATDTQWQSLAGDVVGTVPATEVIALRNRSIDTTAPANGNVYVWNAAGTSDWYPSPVDLSNSHGGDIQGVLTIGHGGTGQTSNGTNGNLLSSTGGSSMSWLANGSNGQVLTMSGGVPSWQPASGGSTAVGLAYSNNSVGSSFNNFNLVGATSAAATASGSTGNIWAWTLGGNSFGVNPAVIGTNDSTELNLNTNNTQRVRIGSSGQVIVNSPPAGTAFQVNGVSGSYTAFFNGAGLGIEVTANSTGASISTTSGTAIIATTSAGTAVNATSSGGDGGVFTGTTAGVQAKTTGTSTTTESGGTVVPGTCTPSTSPALLISTAALANPSGGACSHFIDCYSNTSSYAGFIGSSNNTNIIICSASDERLKENIKETSYNLDLLEQIKVREYNFIDYPDIKIQGGFIAQELWEIYPAAVIKGGEDPKTDPWTISQTELVPLLVKAVQDLSHIVKSLKNELQTLRDVK